MQKNMSLSRLRAVIKPSSLSFTKGVKSQPFSVLDRWARTLAVSGRPTRRCDSSAPPGLGA